MIRHARMPLLAVLLASAILVPASSAAARARVRIDRVERHVIHILNGVRRHYGLGRLALSRRISVSATEHSAEMARTRTISHGNWYPRISSYAGTSQVGEVVGWLRGPRGTAQAHWIVQAWMHSAPHRDVLLRRGFHRLGIGRSSDFGFTFFTVDVAR
jgi:uncharacterized protein YkwD